MVRTSPKLSPEVVEGLVRVVLDGQWTAVEFLSIKIGYTTETLRHRMRQAERNDGPAFRSNHRRAAAHPGTGARGTRTAPSQRDFQTGQRVLRHGAVQAHGDAELAQ